MVVTCMVAEEEIARMVNELMAGRTKPLQMLRVGSTLYKRMTSFDGTAIGKAGGKRLPLASSYGAGSNCMSMEDCSVLQGQPGCFLLECFSPYCFT
jgi:hypothetical protein